MKKEDLRWKKFELGSGGDVCLVDWMGSDASIVQAARVSYGKGTKKVSADDALIRYLMRHRHTTPFEMCEVKLRVRVPMDTWRQWIRHRTASVNEYSTRYSVAIDESAITDPRRWRLQDQSNAQGSDGYLNDTAGRLLSDAEAVFHSRARALYEQRLDYGVAREQARKDLPLSTYTEAYWKVDLHNLLHFLALRMDDHAQEEIREYANVIGWSIVSVLFPSTWTAFQDYVLEATRLTRLDSIVLQNVANRGMTLPLSSEQLSFCWPFEWRSLSKCRERDECFAKLKRIGIVE